MSVSRFHEDNSINYGKDNYLLIATNIHCIFPLFKDTVDAADPFPLVHDQFLHWLRVKHRLGMEPDRSFMVVTDGPFDMGRFLFLQTQHLAMEFPGYGARWANLRKTFANFYKGESLKSSCASVVIR